MMEGEEMFEGEEGEEMEFNKVITAYWCGFDDGFCGES